MKKAFSRKIVLSNPKQINRKHSISQNIKTVTRQIKTRTRVRVSQWHSRIVGLTILFSLSLSNPLSSVFLRVSRFSIQWYRRNLTRRGARFRRGLNLIRRGENKPPPPKSQTGVRSFRGKLSKFAPPGVSSLYQNSARIVSATSVCCRRMNREHVTLRNPREKLMCQCSTEQHAWKHLITSYDSLFILKLTRRNCDSCQGKKGGGVRARRREGGRDNDIECFVISWRSSVSRNASAIIIINPSDGILDFASNWHPDRNERAIRGNV